jgi:hypothetical protein
MNLKIVEVRSTHDLNAFIKFPLGLYKNDPFYAPQLTRDLKSLFTDKNPFFRHATIKFFLAFKNGSLAGRIASIINPAHIEYQKEKAGFFGFFESVDDVDVSNALLGRVYDELKNSGMDIMRGPMNFSTNEECGFLFEGFDTLPMLMTPYNPPRYNDLMEAFGLSKAKDLNAYIYDMQESLPEKVLRVAAIAEKKGVTVKRVEKKKFMQGMKIFREVYNSAWKDNWGFIPISPEELNYSAVQLKPIVVPDLTLIAEKDGEPVGFLGMVPDYNVVLRHMNGKTNPLTIVKALYYSRKIRNVRLLLLGIKEEYRNRGIEAVLFKYGFAGLKKGNYQRVEFSWILEDNINMIRIIDMIGGRFYKKFRIYEKTILP